MKFKMFERFHQQGYTSGMGTPDGPTCLIGAAALEYGEFAAPYGMPAGTQEVWDTLPENVQRALLVAVGKDPNTGRYVDVYEYSDMKGADASFQAAQLADNLLMQQEFAFVGPDASQA